MDQKASGQWDCNESTQIRPDGLPPGWCIQTADFGVSMWMSKREIILKFKSINPPEHLFKRVTVERILGNGKADSYSFVVEEKRDHMVTWLAGTDTGSIKVIKVEPASDHGPLDAVSKLKIVDHPHMGDLKQLENHGPVPVYAILDVFTLGKPSPDFVALVVRNGETRTFFTSAGDLTYNWRGAEWIRTDLYAPWPPI